jgi:hypothetical protein
VELPPTPLKSIALIMPYLLYCCLINVSRGDSYVKNLAIPEPLEFPEEISPLQVECLFNNGPFVGINLRRIPSGLSIGGGNRLVVLPQTVSAKELLTILTYKLGVCASMAWLFPNWCRLVSCC